MNKGKSGRSKRQYTKNKNGGNDNRKGRKQNSEEVESKRGDARSYDDSRTSALNDFSWYNHNPLLTAAVGNVPFPYKAGMSVPFYSVADEVTSQTRNYTIPGILALEYAPAFGRSTGATSPISLVAKEIYARVRAAFSGTLQCDAPDFMIYLGALDSIFAEIGAMKRVFRIINTYSSQNYNVPQLLMCALLRSGSADVNAYARDKTAMFGYINELVGMCNKFFCPAIMDVFNRHYWLNDNVYTDADSPNSQWYVFVNSGMYSFGLDSNKAGKLNYIGVDRTSALSWYNAVRTAIETLANSEDAYTISGYLARAYEGVPQFKVDPIDLYETFNPVFVPEVLAQIENARAVPLDTTTMTLTQSGNALIFKPESALSPSLPDGTKIDGTANPDKMRALSGNSALSIRNDQPTPQDVFLASRLQPGVSLNVTTGTSVVYQLRYYPGSEIVIGMRLWTMNANDSGSAGINNGYLPVTGETWEDFFKTTYKDRTISRLSSFDWSPIVYMPLSESSTDMYPLGDVHNITTLTYNQMAEINKVALYSEYGAFAQQ